MPRSSVRCADTCHFPRQSGEFEDERRGVSAKVGGSRRKRLEREKRNDESPGTANDGNEDNGETISEEYDDDDVDLTVTGSRPRGTAPMLKSNGFLCKSPDKS